MAVLAHSHTSFRLLREFSGSVKLRSHPKSWFLCCKGDPELVWTLKRRKKWSQL